MKKQNMFQIALLAMALFMSMAAMAQSKIYYVSPTGTGDGSSWTNATTLTDALGKAVAGDQIWVQGFEQIDDPNKLYIAPATGFTLNSGVQLYGGFAGTETSINDRETLGKPYQMRYRSVLSGDIGKNDAVDNTNLIFPANSTRTDNATHVLSIDMTPTSGSGNNNTYPTVVNGFSIGGGQADGTDEKGGGIYIYGDNTGGGIFRIERCFFVNNYATQGGAIYVDAEVQNQNNNYSLVNQCAVYNNAAGARGAIVNAGGGIYLAGAATVVNSTIFNNENGGIRLSGKSRVVNTTVARNTGAGIDLIQENDGSSVLNSIIWGNTSLFAQYSPQFSHSAYHEVTVTNTDAGTDGNHNVYVTKENQGDKDAPMFDAPSVKTSFDRDFNWRQMAYPLWSWNVLEGSVMHDKGDGTVYQSTTYGNQDMAGNLRVDGVIDIGAYEFQKLPTGRIRYVKPTATGTGDGSSWDNASGDLQKMIDELAQNNPQNLPGEVWVAAGIYKPQSQLISGTAYSASFRMRDGVSVYGGFKGTETSKQERAKGTMPWDFTNETILEAAYYDHANLQLNNNKWTLTSDSRHVVWFAPMANEAAFSRVTTLDGVTIRGGYAQGGTGLDDFKTDRGAGVYMDGANAYLTNCIVKENYATGNGGGVYLKDGRVETSFIYNNNADADGGAVYVDNRGLVLRSMLANNSAHNGAGAYLHNEVETTNDYPEYLILSTCVVSNNTMSGNGAVYCDKGGVLMQNTITNNNCVTATDATNSNASQTGGIYVDEYALVVNSVIWNNPMGKTGGTNIPMYARNPSASKVRFLYNAISGVNNAVWNYTLQEQTLSLVDDNTGATDDESSIGPRFTEPADGMNFVLETNYGVQEGWKDNIISYYWKPISGSNLWGRGMALGQLPEEVVLAPELDIQGKTFAQKPAVGAFMVEATEIVPKETDDAFIIYVDVECTEPGHQGDSWAKAYRSLNNAIDYLANLDEATVGDKRLEVHVLEGDLWPRYAFTNNDPKTATVTVPVAQSGKPIEIYGGYYRDSITNTVERDPLNHRSVINGNTEAKDITQGLYHCITVQQGAKLVLDGFHVINGYAAGEASRQYGAGLLAHARSTVTVRNCIFENNTAQDGAAIDAREATLTLQNCVVNNNTNTLTDAAVINCPNLTLNHVTVVNNVGAAPTDMGASSFSAGNTSGTNSVSLNSIGADGAKNFANPTNKAGATLGFDTYLGGYSEFRPLTSSTEAAVLINKASATSADNTKDITTINGRNLGGLPDKGAYEAILPESGKVYYVRTNGDDLNDGLSWDRAFATVTAALNKAEQITDKTKRPQIWIAEGTYTNKSTDKVHEQYYGYQMVEGVNVYGGFPATGNPGEDDRNPKLYETILQPGETDPSVMVENRAESFGRVLVQPDEFEIETIWDGFTLRHGYLFSCYRQNIAGDISTVKTDAIGVTGGAGAYLMKKGVLENCVIQNNIVYVYPQHENMDETGTEGIGGFHQAGAGIYNSGGTIRNCIIKSNKLQHSLYKPSNALVQSAWMYGAGLYMNDGTVFNTVIANNTAEIIKGNVDPSNYTGYHEVIVGAGAFLVNGSFYNNTITNNTARTYDTDHKNISLGGVYVYTDMTMYNCIVSGNNDIHGSTENDQTSIYGYPIAAFTISGTGEASVYTPDGDKVKVYYSCINIDDDTKNLAKTNDTEHTNVYGDPSLDTDYHLSTGSPAINTGTEVIPDGAGGDITIPDYDAEYTDRIKDCGIDMGAFESANEGNIGYATVTEADGTKKYVFYVTQNGDGLRSGASVDNAACAMKLQQILTAAGTEAAHLNDGQVYVRIAGDNKQPPFVYHPNTLSNPNDPQSYTYVVPEGIIVEGGYNEDFTERKPLEYPTVLSAVSEANASTIQTVRGYHTVTFGAWPGTATLTKETVIDGLYLIDGSATSMAGAGNPNTRGGGAIVPSGAHVRNCVVTNCEAIEGGGLYLLPGATVSGTAIIECEATNGAGIYADNTDADNTEVDKDSRAHILSCTIANNEASSTGGGLYMKDGAVMNVNTVVFGNRAGSDKNVSGVVSKQFDDNKLATVFNITNKTNYYPFNNCFVETQEMPSDFENRMLESDESLYFADDYYRLKDYSFLIKHGMKNEYQQREEDENGVKVQKGLVKTFNVATRDMQNIDRIQTGNAAERLDAGAFAYEGGILPTELFTRIFVSQTTNVTLPADKDMNDYLGRSFYTSFSTLEDALGYIRSMRAKSEYAKKKFEILVAGGTYKPSYLRTTTAGVTHDQRLYSFVVPEGVSIYGGFSGTEMISSKVEGGENLTSIPGVTGTFTCMGDITGILNARAYSDFNQNNILEPWELANQTILSGQINASSTAQNAYHVVFTDKGTTTNPVVLDGLTVMYGQTDDELSYSTKEDEQGRGGGIYSNGVTYTISRCRLLNNTAVRGGAVFVRNADLNLSGCILAGNKTVANTATDQGTNKLKSRGGAAYVSGIDKEVNLRAVNTLWANNESAEEGGAIGTNFADGLATYHDPLLYIMNNTFVRNKATTNPVIYARNGKSHIVNTLIWGNQGKTYQDLTDLSNIYDVSHCASDVDYVEKFTSGNSYNNILLSTENMGDKGPRFTNPSTEAGADGNSASTLWNPVAISVLTDAGDGTMHTADEYPGEIGHTANQKTGTYQDWFDTNSMTTGYLGKNGVTEAYITKDEGIYSRYSGPYGEEGTPLCKPIDIGVYEYQYISNFSTMTAIYVDTISSGTGSGENWANATDDLRGAIVGAANPTQKEGKRTVYVRDGNYSWDKLSAGTAYILNMSTSKLSESLTLKGSCTGSGDQQDFSKQTVLRNDGATTNLMSVTANTKAVTIEGFTFINTTGTGMNASTSMDASTGTGSLTLKNCGFRTNQTGLSISNNNSGKVLIYNTLFADGGTGLSGADANTTVVNATFANNTTADMTFASETNKPSVYNSVSWNNETNNMEGNDSDTDSPTYFNKVFSFTGTAAANNVDIQNGPNFVDPLNETKENRDYHIRPSVQLLNKGSNDLYLNHVVKVVADADATAIPATKVDLGNNARLVDNAIDVGAYEYEAPLQPIIYVKPDLTGTADGKSWETALGDLQGAVDLAGLYANNNSTNGYVFVHGNYHDTGLLNLTLGNTKVYGGMNDERSDKTVTSDIVSDLLAKRKGMLEVTNRSSLGTVTIGADGVIDGFVVTGAATVNAGALSTSVVKNDVSGAATGLLYNSLVLGDVSGVKAVNVTATGSITGNGNNRASVSETNSYVTDDYWKYQLMETSKDIDPNPDDDPRTDISEYMKKVGHERDLIGNARIRNIVDNGCFETWNICEKMTSGNVIKATDYPVGKSVVYVRKNQELKIQNADNGTLVYKDVASAFNPGFLLLEHQAGLRGNGNYISLTNFAVERDIPARGADLVAMPFDVNSTTSVLAGLTPKRYDGSIRAAYDYKFDDGSGTVTGKTAWTKTDLDRVGIYEGLLFENETGKDQTLRFYGKSTAPYTENGTDKTISLQKYNFNDMWPTDANGNIVPSTSNRFTHKENMSWNLFGSPYLCAMNYSDMEYGRVIYGYNGSYQTVNTAEVGTEGGHIPAGSAVFTQTATLKDAETFAVKQPADAKNGRAFARMAPLRIALYAAGTTRSTRGTGDLTDETPQFVDELQIEAVDPEMARNDFDPGADGVKWMAPDSLPQIYAERGGGRYALLSAVSRSGEVAVSLNVPAVGAYTFALPEDCDASDYEAVLLKDSRTGRTADLLQAPYEFLADEAGTLAGRFTVSFTLADAAADGTAIRVQAEGRGRAQLIGLQAGDRIRVYDPNGQLHAEAVAGGPTAAFRLQPGIFFFHVDRGGEETTVKAVVR